MTIPIPTPTSSPVPVPSSSSSKTAPQLAKDMGLYMDMDSEVELYPHDPASVIPLLRGYLPRTLPVLATVLENITSTPTPIHANTSTSASASASTSPAKDTTIGTTNEERPRPDFNVVYATFPSGSLPPSPSHARSSTEGQSDERDNNGKGNRNEEEEEGTWGVVVPMQEEGQVHLRFFCSAETTSPSFPNANTKTDTDTATATDKDRSRSRAESFTHAVARAIVGIWGQKVVLGAIDSRWNESMRDVVGSRELAECTVFLAPSVEARTGINGNGGKANETGSSGLDVEDEEDGEEDERLRGVGLRVDQANDGDVEMIKKTCDVPRPYGYYASRCPHTTVIRQLTPPHSAVCWIIHHADGALGALYTLPEWRRKGLGAIVVRRRMRERRQFRTTSSWSSSGPGNNTDLEDGGNEQTGVRDFCYVFRGNKASEGLWAKLGWTEGWAVRWLVNRQAEEERGEVERYIHAT